MIAALYVRTGGCYYGLDNIDPWDETRDARLYGGPYAVIAHPPCQRWGKFWAGSPPHISRTGQRKIKGDDGGCFAAALASVRKWGGVLEHPYMSYAWPHFGIPKPHRLGGWIPTGDGGFTCCVEQGRYGHYGRKPTYLLTYGINDLPELSWGKSEPNIPQWAVDRYGLKKSLQMGELAFKWGNDRIDTPLQFRDLLISMANQVNV